MVRAVEKVRELLLKATAALEQAGVSYAVIGGNAVAAWVARVDESAIRNTPDVDVLLRPAGFPAARAALDKAGIRLVIEGQGVRVRDAVHVVFTGEKVRPHYLLPAPDISESERGPAYQIATLPVLVRMKLNSFRIIDRVHLRDMLDVCLIDASWLTCLPPELAARLKELLDNPEG